jgi:hypothetical protein
MLGTTLLAGTSGTAAAPSPALWITNWPGVFLVRSNSLGYFFTTNLNKTAAMNLRLTGSLGTNAVFDHFVERSLNKVAFDALLAATNGRTTRIWAEREHPIGWPVFPPRARWEGKGLLFGIKGFTALSPCWSGEGHSGQTPITALTQRHVYTRGHGMGTNGFSKAMAGDTAWFLRTDNGMVSRKILRRVVRTGSAEMPYDYTILLLDQDLPAEIQPMAVTDAKQLDRYLVRVNGAPWPVLMTEQTGNVSAGIPGFMVETWKGGDSGSPDMILLSNELVMIRGRSTSGPNQQMQRDMDELCRQAKLDPRKYPMRFVDLSGFAVAAGK